MRIPFFADLIDGYCPGGRYEEMGHLLTSIHDRPDPWKGHPYRQEQNRDGWHRWSDAAIHAMVTGEIRQP